MVTVTHLVICFIPSTLQVELNCGHRISLCFSVSKIHIFCNPKQCIIDHKYVYHMSCINVSTKLKYSQIVYICIVRTSFTSSKISKGITRFPTLYKSQKEKNRTQLIPHNIMFHGIRNMSQFSDVY